MPPGRTAAAAAALSHHHLVLASSFGFAFLYLVFCWATVATTHDHHDQPKSALLHALAQQQQLKQLGEVLLQQEHQPKPEKESAAPPKKVSPIGSSSASQGRPQVPTDEGRLSCKGKKEYAQSDPGSVVYWRTWTEETPRWRSPYAGDREERYVTFEPDEGGFNNIRMALETFFVFALATGRTLVLPDEYNMYLLGKKGLQHDFSDFYDMNEVKKHVKVIQMAEFLEKEGLTGRLKDGERPPGNATTFDKKRPLWEYIRRATDVFPVGTSHVVGFDYDLGSGFEPNADAAFQAFAGGRQLFVYGPELHAKRSLHFTSMMDGAHRYLIHYYGFIYLRDPAADRFIKRFVRDVLHYDPAIYCHAYKVVDLLHADSGGTLEYDAIHIRRGDFQYTETRMDVETIFRNVEDVIAPGRLVYVLTDEHNTSFFDPVRAQYRLRYLKDYQWALDEENANPNHAGMVEQIVASGAQNFVGTYFSTLTGYATRMRGYLGKNPGYYFLAPFKNELQDPEANFYAVTPFYQREWPVAYVGIDDAIVDVGDGVSGHGGGTAVTVKEERDEQQHREDKA